MPTPPFDPAHHTALVVEQFSQQAIPFTQVPGHFDAMQILLDMTALQPDDHVLDVACGPGLVACTLARHAAHVTGLDCTPAMLAQAAQHQTQLGLSNLSWQLGDALALPYPDGYFSRVISRYSLHHMLEPARLLAEMRRVCRPGGRVVVADVALPAAQVAAYDAFETLRDPSHVHALTETEFDALFHAADLHLSHQAHYGVDIELEAQLRASFPNQTDRATLRTCILQDIGVNALGIQARRTQGSVIYTVPVRVYAGMRP